MDLILIIALVLFIAAIWYVLLCVFFKEIEGDEMGQIYNLDQVDITNRDESGLTPHLTKDENHREPKRPTKKLK